MNAPGDTLRDAVLGHARKTPDRLAVVDGEGRRWTYGQLWCQAASIGRELDRRGVGDEDVVGLALPQDARFVAGLLGCWWAGAAPLLLDPRAPAARREDLLRRARPAAVIDVGFGVNGQSTGFTSQPRTACDEERVPSTALLDEVSAVDGAAEPDAGPTPPPRGIRLDQLAYVIASSGSSGRPKLVYLTHRGLLPMLRDQVALFGVRENSRVLWALSPGFDASLSDIGTALAAGACLVVAPGGMLADPDALLRLLADERVTHADLPPALLARLPVDRAPATLETVVVGGEVTDAAAVRAWARRLRLVSVYGPTEATICTSARVADAHWDRPWLGAPIGGAVYRVVDGELWIGGLGLAHGYDDPELTAARFVERDGCRWFRTGDLVEGGGGGSGVSDLVFRGRVDRQVKVKGRLVAPEEVEATLRADPDVEDAAVVLREGVLVGFCVARAGDAARLDGAALLDRCRERLPDWMCPDRVVALPRLPRLGSEKVDLEALRAMAVEAPTALPPVGAREGQIVALFAEVLGPALSPGLGPGPGDAEGIGRDSDFFALGGDSFSVVQLLAAAERRGLGLSAELVYRARTPARLAAAIDAHANAGDRMPASVLRQEVERWLGELAIDGTERGPMDSGDREGAVPAAAEPGAAAPRVETAGGRSPRPSPCPLDLGAPILLTGATGFLGVHVLAELLGRGAREVVALVRAATADAARERILRAADRYAVAVDARRVRCVPFDLARDDEPPGGACRGVRSVLHCAASVSLSATFEELAPTNLAATARLIGWARRRGVGAFDHASTLSVQVCADTGEAMPEVEVLECDELDRTRHVHGGYAQSKWAGEVLVARAFPAARRHRFGLPTPSRTACRPQPAERDWLTGVVRGLARLGAAPVARRDAAFDATPVDHAAQAMVAIAENGGRGAYAVCGTAVRLEALVEALCAVGVPVRWCDAGEWAARVGSADAEGLESWSRAALELGLGGGDGAPGIGDRHLSRDAFLATGRRFDARRRDAILPPPTVDDALLRRYVRSMLDSVAEGAQ